jgi:hypothetical protein
MRSVLVIFFGEQSEEVSEVSEVRKPPHFSQLLALSLLDPIQRPVVSMWSPPNE